MDCNDKLRQVDGVTETLQLTGRREGDCNGASSVIFPGPAGADITEAASVTERHGDERETRAKKEVRRARTRTARTTYDRLGRHTTTYDDRESVLFFAQIS